MCTACTSAPLSSSARIDSSRFGSFVADIASPLAIGTVELEDGEQVARRPIELQPRREGRHHEHQHPRHDREHLLLHRIGRLGIEPELKIHGDADEDRKHADRQDARRRERKVAEQIDRSQRVRSRQILDPQGEWLGAPICR